MQASADASPAGVPHGCNYVVCFLHKVAPSLSSHLCVRAQKGFNDAFNLEALMKLIGTLSVQVDGLNFPVRSMYMMVSFFSLCISLPTGFVLISFLVRPSKKRRERFADMLIWAFTFLTFLAYPVLSSSLLRLFDPKVVGSGKLLRADQQLVFEDVEPFQKVGGGFIALYTVGIPAYYFILLWRVARPSRVETKEEAKRNATRYGFLFQSYEERCWWWELVELGRKLLLCSIVIFIEPGAKEQKKKPCVHKGCIEHSMRWGRNNQCLHVCITKGCGKS